MEIIFVRPPTSLINKLYQTSLANQAQFHLSSSTKTCTFLQKASNVVIQNLQMLMVSLIFSSSEHLAPKTFYKCQHYIDSVSFNSRRQIKQSNAFRTLHFTAKICYSYTVIRNHSQRTNKSIHYLPRIIQQSLYLLILIMHFLWFKDPHKGSGNMPTC